MWVNTEIFERLSLTPPKTWAELIKISPLLLENKVLPIAVGDQPWQVRILFNNILIGVAGSEIYHRFYQQRDVTVLREEKLLAALEIFSQLRKFGGISNHGSRWNDQAKAIAEGSAAMFFMGDWAKVELQHMGKKLGKDFNCYLAPQTEDVYMYLVDVFIFGRTEYENEIAAQKKLLAMFADDEVHYKFNELKGSIPAIKKIDVSRLDRCGKIAAKLVNTRGVAIKPYASVIGSGAAIAIFNNAIAEIWLDKKIMVEEMVDRLHNVMETLNE